jgi:hypothetical protein
MMLGAPSFTPFLNIIRNVIPLVGDHIDEMSRKFRVDNAL